MLRILSTVLTALALLAPAKAAEMFEPPLTPADVDRYQQIFEIQERGKWPAADALIAKLENDVLLGYVLEQRYMHPTAYRSSYPELSRWLNAYADHPNAHPVYRLAKMRQGSARAPRLPASRRWRDEVEAPLHPQLEADYADGSRSAEVARIEGRLRYLTREDRATQALNYLNDPRQFNALTAAQTDRARGWIAASYYYNGDLQKAKQVANLALKRSWDSAVLSHWIAGLVAWRQNDAELAFRHFSAQAEIPYQEHELRAAGAFWAARVALRQGEPEEVVRHLEIAAAHPLTFYGQIALAQLGQQSGIDWAGPTLTAEMFEGLRAATPRAERAAALAQVGRIVEAEEELKWAQGELPPDYDTALVALAVHYQLPSAQLVLSNLAGAAYPQGAHLRAGLYPLPAYKPANGFTVDPAVLYGLIRQESKFMPAATSRVGARGLMQLMPRTASYIANDRSLHSRASDRLYDPSYNMQLGQSYVETLLQNYNDGSGDLFEMALSYNWGPGNYRRWQAQTGIEDTLLLIESVPNPEARHFVETVMTNIWVYRDRLGEPAPSRDAVAAGARPTYRSISDF
jgi:soluble lytic murein transglycosylase-like protein